MYISNSHFMISLNLLKNLMLSFNFFSFCFVSIVSCKWQKMKFDGPPPACRLDHAICLGYITTYPKKETETVDTEETKDKNSPASSDKELNESKSDRTNNDESERPSADAEGTASREQELCDVSSEGVEVTGRKDQVNVQAHSGSSCNEICNESSNESVGIQNSNAESVDATAEAVASGLSIEGSKLNPPSAAAEGGDANAEALTSLLSVEGVRRIMSSDVSGGESDGACGEGMQRCLACVIHGGMDMGGEIFDDCLVWRVDGAPS